MHMARSGLAIAAGFVVFSILFTVIGPTLGAILTTAAAGLMAGYLAAKIAPSRELIHGGATAGLVAASLIAQPVLPLPARILVAALAAAAITAGAWVRAQARVDPPVQSEAGRTFPGPSHESRGHQGHGGEERS
jgi:hypothetical protein